MRSGELERLFAQGCPPQETFQEKEELALQLQDMRGTLAAEQLSAGEAQRLEAGKARFSDKVPMLQEVDQVIADWSSCAERKNVLGQKKLTYEALRGIAQTGANGGGRKNGRKSARPALWAGLLVCGAAFLLAGILIMAGQPAPGAIAGALGAVAGVYCIWLLMHKGGFGEKREETQRDLPENDSLRQMEEEIREDQEFIENTVRNTEAFFARYGIVWEASPWDRENGVLGSLYSFKAEVREYITLSERERNAQTDRFNELCLQASEELKRFLGAYYPEEDLKEAQYAAKLNRLKELAGEYRALKEKGERFRRAEEGLSSLQKRIRDFVETLGMEPEEDLAGQLLRIQERLLSYENSRKEYEISRQHREAFEASENVEEIRKPCPGEEDTGDLQEINQRLEEIADRLERIYGYVSEDNRQLDSLREEADALSEDGENLEKLREEYAGESQRYELLKTTREFLEQAKISFTSRYTGPIRESLGKYYEMLTGEDPGRILVDANLNVTIDEQGMQRETRFFSAGYRDLFGICMRMALVDAMYQEEKPFVIFDDPFANLDGEKLKGGLKLLQRIGEEYQVIYLTCHESRVG